MRPDSQLCFQELDGWIGYTSQRLCPFVMYLHISTLYQHVLSKNALFFFLIKSAIILNQSSESVKGTALKIQNINITIIFYVKIYGVTESPSVCVVI